jgi:hypothetical protein
MAQQVSTSVHTELRSRAPQAAAKDDNALMRGLVHGVILSMAVWTAALYLAVILT